MNNPIRVLIIAGSTREGRFSDQVAKWITDRCATLAEIDVEMLDLRDYEMPFFNAAETPSTKSAPYAHEAVARFTEKVAQADAYVVITPEYNHSIPAVLKNAFDWVYQEWTKKPITCVAYGNAGGARAVEHVRQIAVELDMAPLRSATHIPGEDFFPVHFAGQDAEDMFTKYEGKADAMLQELLWWGKCLRTGRKGDT